MKPIINNETNILDNDYLLWIQDLCNRYRQSQIKASLQVNKGILSFYWELGKDIEERRYDNKYGSHFYEKLSQDLSKVLNNKKGLAPTSLRYTKYFYCLYSPLFENCRQLADEFDLLFSIPWSHHQKIIDKVKGDANKGLFFVRKTLENNWGRAVLVNFLETDLYERHGVTMSNFKTTMPSVDGDLAQQLLKDPYHFNFLPLGERYTEKELKDELVDKLSNFLLELGKGFSFVGREFRLSVAGKDKYMDLLFYIIPLHRYCVVEIKVTEFDFQDIGQLAGYTAMVDDLLNTKLDNPSIGLLICKERNNVLAHYALSRINSPIGITEFELSNQQLPEELKDGLPTIEEIERCIKS